MKEYIDKAMDFAGYIKMIDDLLAEGKTTGDNQSDAMLNYGKLNRQRMKRLDKTIRLEETLKERVKGLKVNWIWLIITEGWCGDAAQNIPIIEKIAAENPGIKTRYVLRDENLALMDRYLTNGGRAIPKLICLDGDTLREIGNWGSRPEAAQEYFNQMKSQGLEKELMMENMQRWYNQDKEKSIQEEFIKLLLIWEKNKEQI